MAFSRYSKAEIHMNAYMPVAAANPGQMMAQHRWASASRRAVICRRVIEETHDVKTFVFCSRSGDLFAFKAGQYVMLHLSIDGNFVVRAYSVSSPPTRPFDLQVTVKRTPGGLVSNWLYDHLRAGDEIEIEGPLGTFNFDDLPSHKPLFLSRGSGITPVMSMLRALTDRALDCDIHFIHSARTPRDIIFYSELEALRTRFPNIRVDYVCADADASWSGWRGSLDTSMLLRLVPDIHERTVYSCGPERYMTAMRTSLAEIGLDAGRCHEESFGGYAPGVATVGNSSSSVRFVRSGLHYDCATGETLLDAARNSGLFVPTACQSGICGTCRLVKLSGEVEMHDLGGLTTEEKASGYVLACCSRARGEVSIDL
jgi:ferredoxin-NADP reductase